MTDSIEETYLDPSTNQQNLLKKEKFFYNNDRKIIKKIFTDHTIHINIHSNIPMITK